MSDKTAAELERDAEIARANVAETAESIRNKMSPGQLIDEFAGLFTEGENSAVLSNLKAQIRDNPLPVVMVGAGLAWLMFGQGISGKSERPTSSGQEPQRGAFGSSATAGATNQPGEQGLVGDVLSSVADTTDSVAGLTASVVQGVATDVGEHLGNTARETRLAAENATRGATQAAQDLFQREPLAIAALGLAVGTAIGAMLPRTALEDEQMGRYRDKALDAAEGLIGMGVDEAKQAAGEAYEALKDEADKHGLASDAQTSVAEKVRDVAKAAASKTEKSVRERLAGKRSEP